MDIILITGANRGIGLALCEQLLEKGYTVIAGCRDLKKKGALESLKQRYSELLDVIELDVASESSLRAAAAVLKRERIDVMVNNAAIMPGLDVESLLEIEIELLQKAFDTNVAGPLRMVQAFAPWLKRSERPRILNISSGAGSIEERENHHYTPYAVSKAALNMLTRSLAWELGTQNITTVAISPGWVRTDMGGNEAPLSVEESARSLVQAIERIGPEVNGQFLDRYGKPGEYRW